MAITIDGKQYDETKLDEKCKNAIVQVSKSQARMRELANQSENEAIIIKHHSDYLKTNLPVSALIEAKAEEAPKAAEAPKAEETPKAK